MFHFVKCGESLHFYSYSYVYDLFITRSQYAENCIALFVLRARVYGFLIIQTLCYKIDVCSQEAM